MRDMRGLGEADVTHVQTLANKYKTSLEACGNRYIELTDDTRALVFSKDGVIRYARRADKFPSLTVKTGDRLPSDGPQPARSGHASPRGHVLGRA